MTEVKMIRKKPLSIADITQELNSGIATVKFILKRFGKYLPCQRIDGHNCYPRNTIPVLIKIKESLEAGLLPSEIEQELETSGQANLDFAADPTINTKIDKYFMENSNEDIRVSKDGLSLIKSLFKDIAIQQNRVAAAHEKRAEAEERKAVAIEKRAEAEEKKATAMNHIAKALRQMNHHRIHDSQTGEMAFQAAEVLAADETKPDTAPPELNEPGQLDNPVFDSPDPPFDLLEASEIDMDDLSDLIEDELLLDDLSMLLDPAPRPGDMDDLSASIDTVSTQGSPEIPPQMDDLSSLIDDSSSRKTPEPDSQNPMDDLGALVNETPSLKPEITPEENLKEYKAAVMKIILGLKTDGLNPEEATRRLNKEGVQTISGKPEWSEKAISQIYNFIDSVK